MLKLTSGPRAFGVISDVILKGGDVIEYRHEYLRYVAFSFISLHVLKLTSGPRVFGVISDVILKGGDVIE